MQESIVLEVPEELGTWLADHLRGDGGVDVAVKEIGGDEASFDLDPGTVALVLTIVLNSAQLAEYALRVGKWVNQWREERGRNRATVGVRGPADDTKVVVTSEADAAELTTAIEQSAERS